MASNIIEFFGYSPTDLTDEAVRVRGELLCPFIEEPCTKTLSSGARSGACTIKPKKSGPVICCPNRLYAEEYKILKDVAKVAFGENIVLAAGHSARGVAAKNQFSTVAVFGKRWGGELRLPNRGKSGGYFVDWILAKLTPQGDIESFVAVEVQSIDTTGNYKAEREAYLAGAPFVGSSSAGFNWENVNKRILPQLIYKGHVLRRERLCSKGLFFVCPTQVYDKIKERLGSKLLEYQPQSGALSFMWYEPGAEVAPGQMRSLDLKGSFITTVDQVALAFTSPSNLPPSNVYENAINKALDGVL